MKNKTIHIVGAGITGCTLSHFLKGDFNVKLYEKTQTLGGLCKTIYNIEGIPYLNGPHILHTNEDWIFKLINSAVDLKEIDYKVAIDPMFDFRYYDFPFTEESINTMPFHWQETIKNELANIKGEIAPALDQLIINYYGDTAYTQIFSGWLKKWLKTDPSLINEPRWFRKYLKPIVQQNFFSEKYVVFPIGDGYDPLFKYLTNGCEINLNSDISLKDLNREETIICTGRPDEFVDFNKKLKYIEVSFDIDSTQYSSSKPDTMYYPNYTPFYAVTQFGKMFPSFKKNIIVREYPDGDHLAYPMPQKKYYNILRKIEEEYSDIYFAGRIGSYQFYDMADCIKQAASIAAKIKHKEMSL